MESFIKEVKETFGQELKHLREMRDERKNLESVKASSRHLAPEAWSAFMASVREECNDAEERLKTRILNHFAYLLLDKCIEEVVE